MLKISFKKQTVNKKLLTIASLLSLCAFLVLSNFPAQAASTATVTATVTVQNISVSVADGTVAYGTLGTSSTQDTTSGGLDDSQTATNDGNVTEDLTIKGANTASWTLGASAGSDQYAHKFCTSNCDVSPTWTALTTSNQALSSTVSSSGTSVFDLQISTPTSSSSFTQQSPTVTITASAS